MTEIRITFKDKTTAYIYNDQWTVEEIKDTLKRSDLIYDTESRAWIAFNWDDISTVMINSDYKARS